MSSSSVWWWSSFLSNQRQHSNLFFLLEEVSKLGLATQIVLIAFILSSIYLLTLPFVLAVYRPIRWLVADAFSSGPADVSLEILERKTGSDKHSSSIVSTSAKSKGKKKKKNQEPKKQIKAEVDDQQESQSAEVSKQQSAGISLKKLNQMTKKKHGSSGSHLANAPDSELYIATLPHGDPVTGISFSASGQLFATACEDREVRVFSVKDVYRKKLTSDVSYLIRSGVQDIAFGSTDGQVAVLSHAARAMPCVALVDVGSQGGKDADSMLSMKTNIFPEKMYQCVCLKGSGGSGGQGNPPIVVAVAKDARAAVFAAKKGELESLGTIDTGGICNYDFAVSNDGRFVAAATFTADVRIFEIGFDRMGTFSGIHKILDLAGHRKKVTSIDFSPDCSKVVTASEDGTVRIWNIAVRYKQNEDAKLLLTVGAPDAKKVVTSLSWGRGGYIAAACGCDLHILDSTTGTVEHTVFEAHQGRITDLAWSPAKHAGPQGSITLLASSSEDSTVRLWRGPW